MSTQRPAAGSRHVGRTLYNPLVRRLAALPKPVICAVNGVAAGAGATGAGLRYRAGRAFGQVMAFSKLGSVPDCGGSWFLPRVAGRARDGAGAAGRQPQRGTGRAVGIIWHWWTIQNWRIPVCNWRAIWRRNRRLVLG